MNTHLEKFKRKIGLGARTNKFIVSILHPYFDTEDSYLVKEVTRPNIGQYDIDLFFQGKQYTLSGEVDTSSTITITFYDNDKLELFKKILSWKNDIRKSPISTKKYMYRLELTQLNTIDNKANIKFIYYNVYPKNISDVTYSYSNIDNLMEFSVEFQYSNFKVF